MTTEAPETPCNTCAHPKDAHEEGGDCQEEGCECTAYSVVAEPGDAAEPIPETPGPKA